MTIPFDLSRPLSAGKLRCQNRRFQRSPKLKIQLMPLHCPLMFSKNPCRVYRCSCSNSKCIKHCRKPRHVLIISHSSHRHPKEIAVLRIQCSCPQFYGSFPHPCLSGISSSGGQSSPTFSSRSSSSTRSPPSSQSSIADLSASFSSPYIRPQPRIQISSLLADSHTRSYHLDVVQQPLRTAEFGSSYLSRVPLTPPIIARLTVRDSSGNSVIPEAELPFLVAHLSLLSSDGLTALDMGSFIGAGVSQNPPPLYGNLVSAVEQLEDLQGNIGLFFLFPDVSVRSRGRYQLGVTLTRITSTASSALSQRGTPLAQTRTRPFDAVALDEYIAAPPTRLTLSFIRQGARMFSNMPYQSS